MTQSIETVAVLPAYNEERTVGGVVSACMIAECVDAVIFVDDGSTDDTIHAAQTSAAQYENNKPFRMIHTYRNTGKAEAMISGFDTAQQVGGASLRTVVFLDTDISPLSSRLTPENRKLFSRNARAGRPSGAFDKTLAVHIEELVRPVSEGEEVMAIALLNRNPLVDWARLALGWGALSGCRAVSTAMLTSMLDECQQAGVTIHGWEIEAAMNTYTRKRYDENGQKLNRSIGKQLWPDVVNIGSRVKAGSFVGGAVRMFDVHRAALRGFAKFAAVFAVLENQH